ncbi:MAG: hypothetical protein O9301_04695 [Leptospira sp.]|nr:hypothetical protein [Leptospira sp.]
MFHALLWIDHELAILLKERHLDQGLVLRLALLSLKSYDVGSLFLETTEGKHHERVELSRYDFFCLNEVARDKEVDPNLILSYAFTEASLEILRL